ncbi:toxin-antitoxin system YwqK family antitoxin [Aequorivita antarctica]|uniref:Toxin-antitoxin system YwqK family antitoxin n=1 Tax=Aequorivita antarctica TaxID=153266 RepID=A0A5C6Z0P6_9FLAO|nr:toxin-antitoxin system YwqK family antitoxin [Aequorivita antarctica]TXD73617.1 toxin-antitoxin system YwqK family antitoxin [Aequorivita antarctica]SRX75060.1 hypothetical protein AEQU3_02048 [Aequorivita antarctica]
MKTNKTILIIFCMLISTIAVCQTEESEVKKYYENGNLKSIGNKIGDKMTGEWKSYYENGNLKGVANFINDIQVGESKSYSENGKIAMTGNFVNGKLTGQTKMYYPNGQLHKIGNVIDEIRNGETITYYENGQLSEVANFINGKKYGENKIYHENGKLKEIGEIENGDATGIWKSYYDNGNLESVGKYIEGVEAGDWNYYDKNGKLEDTIKYFDGKQSDNIPPIQKYLDKISRVDTYTDPTKVSQKLSANTFIITLESKSMRWQETYSGIDWSDFDKYRYNEYKDFFVVEFYFYDDIAYEMDDDEFGITKEESDNFKCKFLPEDKAAVLKILEDWKDLRGY